MLELPEFELLKKQPNAPHVARTVAENTVPNKYGALIVYRVEQGRNGKDWWISASLQGMRMSNTLHTSKKTKADEWIRAVKSGQIRVGIEHYATKKSSGRWDDSPEAWQRGFEFAKEAMLHETRAQMREILRRVAESASSSYDYGFLAAYQDEFDVPRTRSHAVKKSAARLDHEIAQSVGKRIDRKKLGELMGPWGSDFSYGEGSGAVGAVSSYYYSDKKYPDRKWVERALQAIEADVPRAERSEAGWTKSDAKDLRRIASGLRYYLNLDYK